MSRRGGMSCRVARRRLPALAGRDLAGPRVRRLWAHLAACEPCRHDYAACLRAHNGLAELASPAAALALAPAADAAFFDALARAARAAASPPSGQRRTGRWTTRAAAAAALIGLGFALAAFGLLDGRSPPSPGLLTRTHLEPMVSASAPARWLAPLSHSQGLEAQRQLLLFFEGDGAPPVRQEGQAAPRRGGDRDRDPDTGRDPGRDR